MQCMSYRLAHVHEGSKDICQLTYIYICDGIVGLGSPKSLGVNVSGVLAGGAFTEVPKGFIDILKDLVKGPAGGLVSSNL